MGSGESDVRSVIVNTNNTETLPYVTSTDFINWTDNNTVTYWSAYPRYIYMYQIKCPRCRKMNWAQLEVITPCIKCTAKLKAVANVPDYTVPVKE